MAHAAAAGAIARLPRHCGAAISRRAQLTGLALAMAGLVAAVMVARFELSAPRSPDVGAQRAVAAAATAAAVRQARVATYTVDDKSQIMVEGADAANRNAAIPLSRLPVESVRAVQLASGIDDGAYRNALKCMSQAIYYEAGFEPVAGKRAVAQVVLNRMRHPAYPHSVCGVVYQGAERKTGCQFSFTCDGALLRPPALTAWRDAQNIAREALAGHVERSVGTATHYHADYVLPKWAFEMAKIEQIGRHIFYRFDGGWGRSAAFSQRYTGFEIIPPLNFAALQERLLAQGQAREGAPLVPGLSVAPSVTDRHAESDVGGRLDVSKGWRLTFADPAAAKSRYEQAVSQTEPSAKPAVGLVTNDATVTRTMKQ